ncbi:MAG: glutamyl-tRNA synthetase [Polyangiales bacterium]|jgi:glutamyl-tRNA synthetase
MHLGHARTALIAWLRAQEQEGKVLMRIEDLDPPRVKAGSEASILRDHEWLGLLWDEGPVRQSERSGLYEEAIVALADVRFSCTCSRRDIRAASAPHAGEGGRRYPGTCYDAPLDNGRTPAIRFRMRQAEGFDDAFVGPVAAGLGLDDFVLQRADGLFAYQLAVVVDDAEAGITEVVRADDLLDSTPKQIALYRALGHAPPAWMHLPLVRAEDGERLSKRHAAPSISAYREAGWSKERILGSLAGSLGVGAGEPASLDELLGAFSMDAIRGNDAVNELPAPG